MTVTVSGGVNPSPSQPGPGEPESGSEVAGFDKPHAGGALRSAKFAASRVYHIAFGEIVVVVIGIAVGAIPLFHEYGLLAASWWLAIWLILYVIQQVHERYSRGKAREGEVRKVARIHGSVAGTIDSIAQKVMAAGDYRIDHDETRALAVGLLHRIKDYACCVLPNAEDAGLRVTLAVPIRDDGRECLKVWCYDQTYADRQWTKLALPSSGERPLPGSPAAFESHRLQIINDIWAIEGAHAFRGKAFRSVLSIPINSGGPSGTCIAVVNMDATIPAYFNTELVEEELYPLVAPALGLLGLVLLLRRKGVDYEFG